LIFHTESWHSNADAYFVITGQDSSTGALEIYLENYVPVYGMQFSLSLGELEGVDLAELSFQNGTGGRAEESGWTIGVNDSGMVIGLAQGTGNPIPAGEGLLTQIPWNGGDFSQLIGTVSIVGLQVSGYFGTEMSFEIGNPYIIEPGLSLAESQIIPVKHALHAAFPNPFNPVVKIPFEIGKQESVSISVFDLNGKAVESLIQNRMMQAGRYQIEWDGRQYASGMYLYSIQAGEFRQTKKMVLLK
jgi:hypothetical protein